jgi:sugar/nucleoside kinase (ribokinase family)
VSGAALRAPADAPYRRLVGVGGIGTGLFLAVEGDRTIGRVESRAARLMNGRDSCKLHTVAHHVSVLLGARAAGDPFHVVPVGVVGDDDAGRRVVDEMRDAGMDVRRVRTIGDRPTLFSVCFQYPNGDGGNLTTSDSAAAALSDADVEEAARLLDAEAIALAQPEVPLGPRRRFLRLAGERGALRAASFTSLELDEASATGMLRLLDVLALNEDEASRIAGAEPDPNEPGPFLRRCLDAIGGQARRLRLVVTAGERGAYAIEDGRSAHRAAPRVEVASTAGCGDALLAGVLVGLAVGAPFLGDRPAAAGRLDDALGLGVALASLNATSPHTIHPSATADVLLAFARSSGFEPGGALADALAAGVA